MNNRYLGAAFLLFAALLLFKSVSILFILIGIGVAIAIATAMGAMGRWGYGLAALFGLMAVPFLLFQTLFWGIAIIMKLAPLLLLLFGVYLLAKRSRN